MLLLLLLLRESLCWRRLLTQLSQVTKDVKRKKKLLNVFSSSFKYETDSRED